jgi:hypothetical protein
MIPSLLFSPVFADSVPTFGSAAAFIVILTVVAILVGKT